MIRLRHVALAALLVPLLAGPAGAARPAGEKAPRAGRAAAAPRAPRATRQVQPPDEAVAVRDPAAWRKVLAGQPNMRAYERTLANGAKRVYVNPSGYEELRAIENTLNKGSDVLEIVHIARGDLMHTMAIFDRQLVHTQYVQGTNNWRLRNWGYGLRPSGTKMYSAMIALTKKQASNLRLRLANAFAEQGPEETAGPKWENGHIKQAFGPRGFNCTSTWCDMPIGENGEPLWQLLGLRYGTGSPHDLQYQLERDGNDKVFGIAVYGPDLPEFGKAPNENVVKF